MIKNRIYFAIKYVAVILILCFAVSMFLGCNSNKNPYDDNLQSYEHEYKIMSLNVDIKVNKDRSARVTETYYVTYYVRSLGISRYLPYANGELYRDIDVKGDVYFITSESNYFAINTGAKNYSSGKVYSSGSSKTYEISYTIIPPQKTAKLTNYYMNVVGHGWSTSQSNVTVNMEFPYSIKSVDVYYGEFNSTSTLTPTVDGKNLSVSISKLAPYQGITVKAEFGKKFGVFIDVIPLVIILVLGLFFTIVVFIKKTRFQNEYLTPVVNFYPPKAKQGNRRLTPAEAGFLIDSVSESEDITSLIFYFASKGYLKIKDANGNMRLLKVVNALPDNEPEHAKIAFDGLFKSGLEVTVSQLSEKYYTTLAQARASLSSDYTGKLYKSTSSNFVWTAVTSILLALATLIIMFLLDFKYIHRRVFTLAIMPLLIMSATLFAVKYKHKYSSKKYKITLFGILALGTLVSFVMSFLALKGIVHFAIKFIIFELPILIAFTIGFCMRRTRIYTENLNQLLGFKDFLLSVEKDKLETMLKDNPEYYYDILPYANVLGVSDIWMEKFEELEIAPPSFYESSNPYFDIVMFNAFYRRSYMSLRKAVVSMPKNKMSGGGFGGGGFGGGGFSGGGFGGGGGGRR